MTREVEETIHNLERQLREATLLNDVGAHGKLLGDTWLNINANGSLTTKAQLLALLESHPFAFLSIDDDDVLVRTYDHTVIVTGRSTRRRVGLDGNVVTQVVRFSRVYSYLENQWKAVSAQSTPILG